ncbi:5-oxoprolinase [Caulobacter sp. D4A]|uniref:hydantoinase/oxoprolinase family protein n=1 Tax=unclassified Caulobacter TaxID=2648921 RepID=UPI000D73C7AB|nr:MULTISPECIES: hydantoinase/oxoprolinase family protein [unclassified Caulobacter]PXA87817.1 5-oxoprolinase [Caulobacter sp. D4A]PXA88806.1 5-oxoprolinase [Caulobacter sp. D5]
MAYRLGVDVGGTFTDLLLLNEATGDFWRHKTPSTPHDSSVGVMTGVNAVCEKAGVKPSDVDVFLHGTTVATNAVLEGKGARVGLVTTEGYHQVMQIARSLVPGGLAAWIIWPKPEPLAKLEDTVEIKGRIDAAGKEIRPLDEADARAQLTKLKEQGVEAVTIALMNAYLNGSHERRVAELAAEILPGVLVSLSHEVLPEMQEYERTLTTVANASVRPVVSKYVKNLRDKLRGLDMQGRIALLRSDGGLMSSEKSEEHPVSLLMSGPAGGVTGALWVARNSGLKNILTLDVGGTSTDVALIENGEPRRVRTTDVGHLTVRASSLDVKTVGAGGGSIAKVPELTRALRVGPESAGAAPGPAAYGKGGTAPTVTDANVVLGYLPEDLLGGAFKLDREAAKTAVQTIADALGVDLYEAARGIIDIVNENMFGALRMISVQQGYDPRDFALMGFGGAGPLHVNAVAKLMGSWPAVSPVSPGVLCALGDATTRMRTETARSYSKRLSAATEAEVLSLFGEMDGQIRDTLKADGVADAEIETRFEIDVRYHGQAFEVPMHVTLDSLKNGGLQRLAAAFDEEHRRLFTFNMDAEHELVNLRAVAMGKVQEIPSLEIEKGDGDPSRAKIRDHEVWADGGMKPAAIYDRSKLRAGDRIPGPAIITEMDSTTLVLPDCEAVVDVYGVILINPTKEG